MPRTPRRARSRPVFSFLVQAGPFIVANASGGPSVAYSFEQAARAACLALADDMRAEALAIRLQTPDFEGCASDEAPQPRRVTLLHPFTEAMAEGGVS